MAKAIELATLSIAFLATLILASHLHYAAGYSVDQLTIWSIACVISVFGFIGCGMGALFAFGLGK